MEAGVTLVFYGVYYGVMGRDCAEMCVDFMAASMTVSVEGSGDRGLWECLGCDQEAL